MNIAELLADYNTLPEYSGINLTDVSQVGLFGDCPIHVAAVRGRVWELQLLFENGADINCIGEYGYTPLHYASEQDHKEAVDWLIAHGADPTIKNTLD